MNVKVVEHNEERPVAPLHPFHSIFVDLLGARRIFRPRNASGVPVVYWVSFPEDELAERDFLENSADGLFVTFKVGEAMDKTVGPGKQEVVGGKSSGPVPRCLMAIAEVWQTAGEDVLVGFHPGLVGVKPREH